MTDKFPNDYYAFGKKHLNSGLQTATGDINRWHFNGKEWQTTAAVGFLDYGARMYDQEIGRWFNPDLLSEKYYPHSPYSLCAGNPISRIDNNGKDWYTTIDGVLQYHPDITSQEQLQDGQKYIGQTYQVKNDAGFVTQDYRGDGSIMFSNESEGYSRIWNGTSSTGNEEMGVITNLGVLVLPNYKNTGGGIDIADYGYSIANGNIVDAQGVEYDTLGTVHTHPSGIGPSDWSGTGYGDLGFASYATPYKPVYVLQMNGINAVSFIVSAPNTSGTNIFNYERYNITQNYPNANPSTLMNGRFSLIRYTKSNDFRSILNNR